MEVVKLVGTLSNQRVYSENPLDGLENLIVSTVDGYFLNDLECEVPHRIKLYRLEIFGFENFKRIIKLNNVRLWRRNSHFFTFEIQLCDKNEADVGVFSYFSGLQEGYLYYKLVQFRTSNLNEASSLYRYISDIKNSISLRLIDTNFEYKKRTTKYIKSNKYSLYVEPVGQGNMAVIKNSKGESKILFDVGHGAPINKNAIDSEQYAFDDKLKSVETVFLSHWDEDHFRLANHPKFSYLKDCFWFFPFSSYAINCLSIYDALHYESRLLVWETLLDITANLKFYLIEHNTKGKVPIGVHNSINYECGNVSSDSNNRGVVIRLEQKLKFCTKNILIPGDADYSNFENIYKFKYSDVIASHHGSRYINSENLPKPSSINSKFIFSFGFHSKYKHPSEDMISRASKEGYIIKATNCIFWQELSLKRKCKLKFYKQHSVRVKVL